MRRPSTQYGLTLDTGRRHDLRAGPVLPRTSQITYLLRTNAGTVPIAGRRYRLVMPGETITGETDADGLIAHYDLPPGDYHLDLDGWTTVLPTLPTGSVPIAHAVRGFYLSRFGSTS